MAEHKRLLEWERAVSNELDLDCRLIPDALALGLVAEFFHDARHAGKFERAIERLELGAVPTTRRPGVTRLIRAGILHLISHRIMAKAAAPIKSPAEIKITDPDIEPEPDGELPDHQAEPLNHTQDEAEFDQWQSTDDKYELECDEPEPELDVTAAMPEPTPDHPRPPEPPPKVPWEKLTSEQQAKLNAAWAAEDRATKRYWEAAAQAAIAKAPPASPATITNLVHVVTGKTAILRSGKREADLRGVYYYAHGARYRRRFRHSALFLAWLRKELGNRDPLDRELVNPDELGKLLNITFTVILEIEIGKTKYEDEEDRCRGRSPRRPFRVTTIQASNMTRAQLTTARRKIRKHAAEEEMKMQTNMQATADTGFVTYDQRVANNRAQREALYEAITAPDMTVAALMAVVQRHQAWRHVPKAKLPRTIVDRLDTLEDANRIFSRQADGPRGSRMRLVTRTK